MKRKIWKLIVLHICICFIFLTINVSSSTLMKKAGILDDPITINPKEPNGNFEWYITPVYVTFHAEDDIQLSYIYYKIITKGQTEPNWTHVDIRDEQTRKHNQTIKIDFDGVHSAHFYAVDHVGNIGPIHTSTWIRIDMSSPEVSLTKEKISFYEKIFTANAIDSTSGIYTVKFYLDNDTEPENEDTTAPYQFIWTGVGNHTITAKACDFAGNEATSENTTKSNSIVFKRISNTIDVYSIILKRIFHK